MPGNGQVRHTAEHQQPGDDNRDSDPCNRRNDNRQNAREDQNNTERDGPASR